MPALFVEKCKSHFELVILILIFRSDLHLNTASQILIWTKHTGDFLKDQKVVNK